MTNEQLAELIQDGITELMPSLWEQVEKFFYLQAGKWFYKYPDMCSRAGVELQDLEQESYFAFLDVVRYYKREDGNKFLSYATFPIKTRFNDLLGLRYEAQTHLPLNGAVNIEKPIGEEDITLLDTLECPAAAEEFLSLEARIDNKILRDDLEACIDNLKPVESAAIRCRYFEGLTLEETGERLGVSRNMAKSREADGLRNLRRGQNGIRLKKYRADIISSSCMLGGFERWRNTHTSSTEWAVLRMDEADRSWMEKYKNE